jgi:hypothetical protein
MNRVTGTVFVKERTYFEGDIFASEEHAHQNTNLAFSRMLDRRVDYSLVVQVLTGCVYRYLYFYRSKYKSTTLLSY